MKIYCLMLIAAVLSGCGHFSVPVRSDNYSERTGVVVTAAMLRGQFLLFKTEGARISFDGGESTLIPWRTPTFIELTPGEHAFIIWHKYTGIATGSVSGCTLVTDGEVSLMQYRTAQTIAGRSDVKVATLLDKRAIPLCAGKDQILNSD